MLGNNITFGFKVVSLRRRIFNDISKEHMKIINGKLEDHNLVRNLMEQTSQIFSISFQNNNYGKGDIRTDIKVFIKQCLWQ